MAFLIDPMGDVIEGEDPLSVVFYLREDWSCVGRVEFRARNRCVAQGVKVLRLMADGETHENLAWFDEGRVLECGQRVFMTLRVDVDVLTPA